MIITRLLSEGMEKALALMLSYGLVALLKGDTASSSAVDFVMVPIFKGANEILTMVNSFSPIDALSTGRSVSWTTLATALFQIWGLIGGFFAAVGMIIFQRRELATVQGRG